MTVSARERIASLNLAIEEAKRRAIAYGQTLSSVDVTPPPLTPREESVVRSALQDAANRNFLEPGTAPLPDLRSVRPNRILNESLQRTYNPDEWLDQVETLRRNTLDSANDSLRSRGINPIDPSDFPSSIDRPRSSIPLDLPPTQSTNPLRPASQQLPPSNPPLRSTGPDLSPINRTPRSNGANVPLTAGDMPRPAQPSNWAPVLDEVVNPQTLDLAPPPGVNNIPQPMTATRPSALSRAAGAGRSAAPMAIAGGLLDFGMGLASGESAGRAAAGAVGSTTGAVVGTAIGALAGPIGAFAGGMIGGFVGGWLGDRFGDTIGLPVPGADPGSMSPYTNPFLGPAPPFLGGQVGGATYNVSVYRQNIRVNGTFDAPVTSIFNGVPGRITGYRAVDTGNFWSCRLYYNEGESFSVFGNLDKAAYAKPLLSITSIVRADGQPDTGGNPAPDPRPGNLQMVYPGGYQHPMNSPDSNYSPNTTPNPGATPRPQTDPNYVPSGHPNARNEPRPETLPGLLPQTQPQRNPDAQPNTGESPSLQNYTQSTPLSQPGRYSVPEGQYNQPLGEFLDDWAQGANPNTQQFSNPNDPLSPVISRFPLIPAVMPATPQPTGLRNQPDLANAPGTGTQTQTQLQPSTGTGLDTGDIPSPTCKYDGLGIAGKVTVVDSKVETANTTLTVINTLLNEQILTKVNAIDSKLGPQVTGGISGLLGTVSETVTKAFDLGKRTWNFLQIDRVLHVLTWIGVLHNAYMLSNNLAQTLFEGIGNVLNVFGIEDEDGNSLDVGEMVGNWTNSFFISFLGQETVTGIKEGWKRANRIYQAATNIIFSLQSITFSMVEMLETISNYTGRIGNALKRSGTILSNSFNWMNPSVNYTNNRFFNALNNAEEAVETINQIASETLNIQEVGAQLFDQKEEFETALDEGVEFMTQQESVNKGASTRPNLVISPLDEARAEAD